MVPNWKNDVSELRPALRPGADLVFKFSGVEGSCPLVSQNSKTSPRDRLGVNPPVLSFASLRVAAAHWAGPGITARAGPHVHWPGIMINEHCRPGQPLAAAGSQ
eukprot:2600139-Rhodomonas_salina.1